MKCENCGADINAKFCPYCGHEIPNNPSITIINNYYQAPSAPSSQPSVIESQPEVVYRDVVIDNASTCNKWVDFCLCFFLGYFGIHKFYEGKIKMGIIYLFTCGLFCIGVIVDLIMILCNSAKDNKGRIIR